MSIYTTYKPSGDNDLYAKLLDGDKIRARIVSEPAISVYKQGDKPRYSWVIFTKEKNGKPVNKPQVLTKGISVYNGVADLVEDWGNPDSFDVTIKRTGSGLSDTEYSVNPVKESNDLTKEQSAEVEKVDLLQAIKGKWLADYVEDNELPEPVTSGVALDTVHPVPEGEPMSMDEMPEDFLK